MATRQGGSALWFRMNPSSEDPSVILTEEGQWTEPWGSSDDGAPCDKCGAAGRTAHECWSCELGGASDCCPVCQGKIHWEAECPVCRGSGRVDGKPRRGVSVFPSLQGLYHYMEAKGADLEDCLVVELKGEPSGDLDFDADQGAMLVIPTEIVDQFPPDRPRVAAKRCPPRAPSRSNSRST